MAWISSISRTVFPTPAPPNIAALPPNASGTNSIDHLDAGLECRGGVGLRGEWRRSAVNWQPGCLGREGRPMVMQQAAEHRIPHWSGRWSPDGEHRVAPRQAGGGMDGHGPRRGGVKMALHLGYEPTTRVKCRCATPRRLPGACHPESGHQRRGHAPRLRGRGRQSPEDIHDGSKPSRLVHSSWSRSRALTQVNAVVAAAVLGCGCKAARSGSREGVRDATW